MFYIRLHEVPYCNNSSTWYTNAAYVLQCPPGRAHRAFLIIPQSVGVKFPADFLNKGGAHNETGGFGTPSSRYSH